MMWRSLSTLAGVCMLSVLALAHDCIHHKVTENFEPKLVEQPNNKGGAKATVNLDIEVVYDTTGICSSAGQVITRRTGCSGTESYTCTSSDVLTSTKLSYLQNEANPSMLSFWQSTLQVEATVPTTTVVTAGCCAVSSTARTSSSTFVLYVTFYPTDKNADGTTSTIAWASACQRDQTTGRPIAGQINYGPNAISDSMSDADKSEFFYVAVHEMAHALAFSSSSFNYFKDSSGITRTTVVQTFTENSHTVSKIVTPSVISAVRNHFGCSTLNGGEIENGGGSGTAGSHWEMRIFKGEFMTGQSSSNSVISPITLALFEDSGWYTVLYDNAKIENLLWGRNEGCTFATGRCSSWSSKYFCTASSCSSTSYLGCTLDRSAKAYCSLSTYSSALPSYYQYFTTSTLGGSNDLLDYCPIYTGYSNRICSDTTQTSNTDTSDIYAADSLCFKSTAKQTTTSITRTDGCGHQIYTLCHRNACINNNSPSAVLRVYFGATLGSVYVDCPVLGGDVDIYAALTSGTCSDTPNWTSGYSSPSTCSDFGSSCTQYSDIGQYTNCKKSCGFCAPYSGTLTCPPVEELCSTSGSAVSVSPTPTRSNTATRSKSASQSRSASPAVAGSNSPSITRSSSNSPSRSPTMSRSVTQSKTMSPSSSVSKTASPSAAYQCISCPQGEYASACSVVSIGICVSCGSCLSGQYRDGCVGTSAGSCLTCRTCPDGYELQGCGALTSGTCVAVSPSPTPSITISPSQGSEAANGGKASGGSSSSSSTTTAAVASVVAIVVVGGAAVALFVFCRRKRVPFSNRSQIRPVAVGSPVLVSAPKEVDTAPVHVHMPQPSAPTVSAPLRAPNMPLPPPPPRPNPWKQYLTNDGKPYFYNETTGETTWTRPAGL